MERLPHIFTYPDMAIHHDTSRNHRTARQQSSEFQIFPTKERYQQKLLSADDLPDSGCGLWIAKVVQFRAPAQERRRKIWDNSGMLPTVLAEFDTILAEGLAFPVLLASIFWISPFRCVASWLLPFRAFKIEGKHLHSCTTILPFCLSECRTTRTRWIGYCEFSRWSILWQMPAQTGADEWRWKASRNKKHRTVLYSRLCTATRTHRTKHHNIFEAVPHSTPWIHGRTLLPSNNQSRQKPRKTRHGQVPQGPKPCSSWHDFFTTNSSRRLGVRIGSPGIWRTSPCWHQDELKRNRSSSFLSMKHLHWHHESWKVLGGAFAWEVVRTPLAD